MKKSTLKRTGYLIATIILCFLTNSMFTGTLQNHIYFAGVVEEISFTFMLIMLTICTSVGAVSYYTENQSKSYN